MTEMVANGLKEYCKFHKYDYMEKLREDSSVQNFYKIFCKITNTYFVDDGNGYCDFDDNVDTYDVTFKKKENIAIVKRCGADWDKRSEDAIVNVKELIKELVR